MSDDPLDQLSARLFQAVREEPRPVGAEGRALQAARREVERARTTATRSRLLLLAAAFASIAVAVIVLSKQKQAPISIAAEHPSSLTRAPIRLPATSSPPPSHPAEAKVVSPPASAERRVAAPARSAPATLADELEALQVAEKSLSAGDPAASLKALDRYDRILKGQKLRAEATLLRIEALAKSGRSQAAAELAARFVEQNPSSPLIDRARSFVEKPGVGGSEHE